MARGINKVILIGHLGIEPEARYASNGNVITTLSLATTELWKDKTTGERQERTEWHRVVCFTRLAEIAKEYLHKGSKVYVEGSLRTRKWQDQQGQDRYTTEIIASELQMLDSRNAGGGQQGVPNYEDYPQAQASSYQSKPQAEQPVMEQVLHELDDDVPF